LSRENKADIFSDDIDLKCLFDIINPENNLVLADDMMLSAADGTILRVSETYEQNFGFAHGSIVGKSAFDLEADGTFSPCITARVIRERSKVITTQTINRTHKNVMTVGIPLFDSRGTLKYAVCFNTVSRSRWSSTPPSWPSCAPGPPPRASWFSAVRLCSGCGP